MSLKRYPVDTLREFVTRLFRAAGCDADKPEIIAQVLLEGDLLGHTTHGLQLAAPYLQELASGSMQAVGQPEVIHQHLGCQTWHGRRLPGVWLVHRAIEWAIPASEQHGIATVVIQQSHHIACLAAFLEYATSQGKMILLASSDPAGRSVAPFGGREPVYTPNPLAVGIPTPGEPILIDISASITTNGMASRLQKSGRRFPGAWALDAEGQPTDDPNTLLATPPGSLLPTGGLDHGHKGYGLALMIEALTQALSGFGRADQPRGWGASVFLQVIDPAAFGGLAAFQRQTGWLVSACQANAPRPGVDAVRLPGQRGLAHKREALQHGLPLRDDIWMSLHEHARRLNVPTL